MRVLLLPTLLTITINSYAQKIVLIEQFTNAGCPPCATYTPQMMNYVNQNSDKVVTIAYHPKFPYLDSMYYDNPVDADARVAYYGVGSTPYSYVDGNYVSGPSSSLLANINTTIQTRSITTTQYSIDVQNLTLGNNVLKGKISFTSSNSNNSNQDLKAFAVAVEKNVLKSAYTASPGKNTETEYKYVMRKMLPDASGYSLIHKGNGETDTLEIEWQLQKIKSINELSVVVFVQNATTKEVYQAAIYEPIAVTSGVSNKNSNELLLSVSPNPTKLGTTLLRFAKGTLVINIYNSIGKLVYNSNPLPEETLLLVDTTKLASGIYIIEAQQSNNRMLSKLIIE